MWDHKILVCTGLPRRQNVHQQPDNENRQLIINQKIFYFAKIDRSFTFPSFITISSIGLSNMYVPP